VVSSEGVYFVVLFNDMLGMRSDDGVTTFN
jgi:hypothetical protein